MSVRRAAALATLLLTLAAGSAAAEVPVSIDLHGYYWARGNWTMNLFDKEAPHAYGYQWALPYQDPHHTYYMTMRGRFEPEINVADKFLVKSSIDVLDGVVWGDNENLAATPMFAANPSTTLPDGSQVDALELRRLWVEWTTQFGLLRIGRQPSHWGMGLLANSGDGFDDAFGDNYGGSTYDRVLFATRPTAVAQGIAGKEDSGFPLIVAFGIDRLVEDPLIQYYGYDCSPDIAEGEEDWDERCDSDGDGVTDLDHGYSDDERTAEDRHEDWWADQQDDVYEMIYVLMFKGEDIEIFGTTGDLVTGMYVVNRRQQETESNVLIIDYYLRAKLYGVLAEFEGLNIRGKTNAIVLPGSYDPYGDLDNPLYKEAGIWGYVGRLGYETDFVTALMEHGFASGDDNVADVDFSGRPLHADFNVGLLIYEEILARVTAATWSESARGLWSNGGVYNSRYIFPQVKLRPVENTEIIGAFLMAWPHKPDGTRVLCAKGDDVDCAQYIAKDENLGWELDLAVKHRWREHMLFSLEAAYAQVSDRLPLEAAGLDPEGRFFTLQSRIAFEF